MSFAKRVLLVLHCVFSLVALAALVFHEKAGELVAKANEALGANITFILTIVLIALYVIITLGVLAIAFSRKKGGRERGFVTVDSSDGGATRVSVTAIDQMIRQAVSSVDGIAEMKVFISPNEDTVDLKANVAIESGSHVPTVTLNLQNAVRKYIEVNCGVAVRKISVNIVSMQNAQEPGALKRKAQRKAFPQMKKERQTEVPEKKAESFEPSPSVKEYQPAAAPEAFEEDRAVESAMEMPAPQTDDLPELQMPKLELTPTPADSPEDSQSSAVQGEAVSDFAKRFSHADDAFESSEEPQEVE